MSTVTENQKRWGEFLLDGKVRQGRGELFPEPGSACLIGAGILSLGYTVESYRALSFNEQAAAVGELGVTRDGDSLAIEDEVFRVCGKRSATGGLIALNDWCGVDFQTFGRAIIAAALKKEEGEYGNPIVPSERPVEAEREVAMSASWKA